MSSITSDDNGSKMIHLIPYLSNGEKYDEILETVDYDCRDNRIKIINNRKKQDKL